MASVDIWGISNCDTVKRARAWLDSLGIGYAFHDYKKEGADPGKLAAWSDVLGWEALLNRRGTTFRALSDADKAAIDQAKALHLMHAHPSLIRRPVLEYDTGVLAGFDPALWSAALGKP